MAWKQAALHWIFNLVEIACARWKISTKFGFCSLTRNFQPLAGNYLCNGILRELYVYNGNINKIPAPLNFTTWTCLIFGFSDRTVRPLVRRPLWRVTNWGRSASPKNQADSSSGNTFSTEGCCPPTPEQRKGGLKFPCAGTFWFFSVMKRTYRTTWRKYKWTIKVEDCRLISYLRCKIKL